MPDTAPQGQTTATATPGAPPAAQLLLVDDEPSVLSALRRLFRTQGYKIEQATGAAEALVMMANQKFDLVISDMRMPEMDGAAFLEQVRDRHPDTVRMLLTGYADIGSTVAAINRGEIHRYISKPWDDQDMLLLVGDALKRREMEHEVARLQALTHDQNLALRQLNETLEARVASRTSELEQTNGMLDAAYEELKAQFMLAVTVFSGLLEMRQDGIAGHSRRVAELGKRVAARLQMTEREQQDVYLAALLHDIGKIGFPDTMLGKPVSKYGPDELARYHRHPLDGEAALMPLEQLHRVALIIRQHHERFDGRGFPDGLRGPTIKMGARIVAAVSDFDGLTSGNLAERVYTTDNARQAIAEGINSHYDPAVVAELFGVLAEIEAEAIADVEVAVADLLPRMKLSKDLLTAQGVVLLPAGHVFQPALIQKITEFSQRQNLTLVIRVLRSSIKPAGPPKTPVARGAAT